MRQPLVSIIIPNYNKGKYIKEAIDSALNQTYRNIEVIVVDDGSTDNSIDIIESYGKKIMAYFLPHKNANVARNFGLSKSRGEYIQFLDSDDLIEKNKIEKQVKIFQKENVDIVLCYWRHLNNDGSMGDIRKIPEKLEGRELLKWLLIGNWFAQLSPLYKKDFIKDFLWDESLRRAQDSDFHFKVALNNPKVITFQEVLCLYRNTDINFKKSKEYRKIWLEDSYNVYKKLKFHLKEDERKFIVNKLFNLAENAFEIDKKIFKEIIKDIKNISPHFIPDKNILYRIFYLCFGFEFIENLLLIKRRFIR